uniref:Uncharacterized protein n=1 Tax=Meloidogyne enterolobii TaxID=390850 RepID=A0A6V7WYF7_MELEN|nr:unnamed protein product [Meloidogyne enterolobii]
MVGRFFQVISIVYLQNKSGQIKVRFGPRQYGWRIFSLEPPPHLNKNSLLSRPASSSMRDRRNNYTM